MIKLIIKRYPIAKSSHLVRLSSQQKCITTTVALSDSTHKHYYWHGHSCKVIMEPVYRPKVIRNCLIQLDNGTHIVVPRRALRLQPTKEATNG